VTVNVSGAVVTEKDLVDAIHAGLISKQQSNVSLGWT
jgi:hypothetical protein